MKYKNYRNSYTNDNRIYSFSDIYKMPLSEVLKRKEELLSQYRVLGIPTEKELQGSDNVVYVHAYTREDGTAVRGHWRSKPEGSGLAGSSSNIKNVKTENIEEETVQQKIETNNNLQHKTQKVDEQESEQENQKSEPKQEETDKRLYPDEIAGVKRGKPKTFEQMMQQGVNPKYMSEEDVNGRYSDNCACCTVAAELVIRGYDVEAGPYSTPEAKVLAKIDKSAYLDPVTEEECVPQKIDVSNVDCYDYLDKTIKLGERYEFSYSITPENGKWSDTTSHRVIITRDSGNELLIYDPQDGKIADKETAKLYIDSVINEYNTEFLPRILRVDDKALNPMYINKVVRKH